MFSPQKSPESWTILLVVHDLRTHLVLGNRPPSALTQLVSPMWLILEPKLQSDQESTWKAGVNPSRKPGLMMQKHPIFNRWSLMFIHFPYPIGSMYGIYGNIYDQYTPNVSINLPYIRILWVSTLPFWRFPQIGNPQNGWFIMDNPQNGWFFEGFHNFLRNPQKLEMEGWCQTDHPMTKWRMISGVPLWFLGIIVDLSGN